MRRVAGVEEGGNGRGVALGQPGCSEVQLLGKTGGARVNCALWNGHLKRKWWAFSGGLPLPTFPLL